MFVLTGAGGFIGSVMLKYLNKKGYRDIVIFDDLPMVDQYKNLVGSHFRKIYLNDDYEHIQSSPKNIDCVIHLGANSNTLENDWSIIYRHNISSTRAWHDFCQRNDIPFIFASSAAVYGNGHGPMNHYAFSKWSSEQEISGVILRLFNVYGPNEYHKGRMASTILHWFQTLLADKRLELYTDSDRFFRDFIWVEDVCKTIYHFIHNYKPGLYDVGTGNSHSFDSIADKVLRCTGTGTKDFISMPGYLQSQYQVHTQANTSALKAVGVDAENFVSPDFGVEMYWDYIGQHKWY